MKGTRGKLTIKFGSYYQNELTFGMQAKVGSWPSSVILRYEVKGETRQWNIQATQDGGLDIKEVTDERP